MDKIRLIQRVYDDFKNPLDFLENYEFSKLNPISQYQIILLVFLARRNNKYLPKDPEWLQKQIHSPNPVILGPLMGTWFEKVNPLGGTYDKQGYLEGSDMNPGDRVEFRKDPRPTAVDVAKFDQERGFKEAWAEYPAKIGKGKAWTTYKRSVKTPEDHARLMKAMQNYTSWIRALNAKRTPDNARPWLDGKTFFNNWEADYEDFTPPEEFEAKKPESFQEKEKREFLEGADK